jgi:ABC-2 type transport system ATP-binding protein
LNGGGRSGAQVAVEVEGLSRYFGAFAAVEGLSFEVPWGQIFGFLGPNGAGKTTTIKILAGLLEPSRGRATVAGFDVATESRAIKSVIGYMSQLFSLYADLTVEENIDFFAGLYGVERARRAERRDWVLAISGLAAERKQLTGSLSLGFKQRLALGCAVLHEPPIVFLDEPTSGVDPLSRRRFWDLIHQLAAGGTTIFVSTHYMEEAEYCHRLALMNRGKLIALDSPAGLREASREPLFELEADEPVKALAALDQNKAVRRAGLFGRKLHVTLAEGEGAEALRSELSRHGIAAKGLRQVAPSLEDVFIAHIEKAGGAPVD